MKIKLDKTTYYIAPVWAGLVALLLLSCVALGYYYYDQNNTNKRTKANTTKSITARKAEVGKLSPNFSEDKAEHMRANAARIREAMKTGAEVDRFVASLRPMWSIVSRSEESNDEYIRRRYQIARGSVPVTAWNEILGLATQMQGMYSLALTDADISTIGDNNKREFSRISFSFTVYVKKPN